MAKARTLVLTGLLALILAACARAQGPSDAIDWPQIDPAALIARAHLSGPTELQASLSPDGRWLAPPRLVEAQQVQVYSTTGPERTLQAELDPSLGAYLALGPWAPDSQAFLLYSAEHGYSNCPFNQVILVRLDEEAGALRLAPMNPLCAEPSPFVSASWSPDGRRLALTLNRQSIYLLDREARLQDTLTPRLSGGQISGLWWTESGLLVHVGHVGQEGQRHRLYRLDPERPGEQRLLVDSPTSIEVVGLQAGTGRVLLREQDLGYPPAPAFQLLVLDASSGEVQHTHTVQGSQCVADPAPHPRYTPLKVAQSEGACTLWFYDWSQDRLREVGPLTALVGWKTDAAAYLVVRGAPPSDLHFERVRP